MPTDAANGRYTMYVYIYIHTIMNHYIVISSSLYTNVENDGVRYEILCSFGAYLSTSEPSPGLAFQWANCRGELLNLLDPLMLCWFSRIQKVFLDIIGYH